MRGLVAVGPGQFVESAAGDWTGVWLLECGAVAVFIDGDGGGRREFGGLGCGLFAL